MIGQCFRIKGDCYRALWRTDTGQRVFQSLPAGRYLLTALTTENGQEAAALSGPLKSKYRREWIVTIGVLSAEGCKPCN